MRKINKRGQEEIVGFALIIIIVAVVLLFLLSFTLKNPKKEAVESYEANSFVQATLQYTVECGKPADRDISLQALIYECLDDEICVEEDLDRGVEEVKSCKMLNTTLTDLLRGSWQLTNTPVKGYDLMILKDDEILMDFQDGSATENFKGTVQTLPDSVKIGFKAYY